MSRIKSLDLARGFTVLMIAPIHTVMLYSRLDVRDTLMGKLLAFIAEGPGAQLFMLLMGLSFALSANRANPPAHSNALPVIIKRILMLLFTGYALNAAKFFIPYCLGWLPDQLLRDLQIDQGQNPWLQFLLIGDILQFAAIAAVILAVVTALPYPQIISLILASQIWLLAPFAWDLHHRNPVLDYLLRLAGGSPPQIFFPLFPWLVYPLVGFSLGSLLKNREQRQHAFRICWHRGWVLIIAGAIVKCIVPIIPARSFYRTYADDTMIHLGIVLLTLSVWEWISKNVTPNDFFDALGYMSRNITAIYIIQWVVIFWMLPLFSYHGLSIEATLLAIGATSFLTMRIFLFFRRKPKTVK